MPGLKWNAGEPPESQRGKRLLLIASPMGGTFDIAEDNRPSIYIGHFLENRRYAPARIWGMPENDPRPDLDVKYWAEINLPAGVELRALSDRDFLG